MNETMRSRALVLASHFLTLVAASTVACDRTPETKLGAATEKEPGAAPPGVRPRTTSAAAAPADAENHRLPSRTRLVAIGDIHGDIKALRGALRLAGAIDGDDEWIGKDLTVVQTGDQIDRGDQDREVLDLLEKLQLDARKAGSELHVLNGNHELMNVGFDFRYVTAKSFASFADFSQRAPVFAQRLPADERGRAAAFAPGAAYALKLSQHLTVALIGDSLFAHGGVLPAHVDYGLSRINREAKAYLAGELPDLPKALTGEDSPVWTRAYGSPQVDEVTCEALGRVLSQVGAKRLVVGHTVQPSGISSACSERLFRIDVGLSAYYGNKPPQVLEITAARGARVLNAAVDGLGAGARTQSAPRDSALHSAP